MGGLVLSLSKCSYLVCLSHSCNLEGENITLFLPTLRAATFYHFKHPLNSLSTPLVRLSGNTLITTIPAGYSDLTIHLSLSLSGSKLELQHCGWAGGGFERRRFGRQTGKMMG
jgi:hypothetical protein